MPPNCRANDADAEFQIGGIRFGKHGATAPAYTRPSRTHLSRLIGEIEAANSAHPWHPRRRWQRWQRGRPDLSIDSNESMPFNTLD